MHNFDQMILNIEVDMKFNKKVPLMILIICLILTLISVYQEHEKKALYGKNYSLKILDAKAHLNN